MEPKQNKHFVYALNCGATDIDGHPCITFGRSSRYTWTGRYRNYKSSAAFDPDLLGVLECYGMNDARRMEKAVLQYTAKKAPLENARSEMRRVDVPLLMFIGELFREARWLLGKEWNTRKPATEAYNAARFNRDDILNFVKMGYHKRSLGSVKDRVMRVYRKLEDN